MGDQVWVADGVYYPGSPGDERTVTFQLRNGVEIYGGFAGTEGNLEERDWNTNITILSGDLDGNGLMDEGNAYHVVTGSDIDASAVLDGFTITAGNANGDPSYGGGYIIRGNPTLRQLIIANNNAGNGGAGMYLNYSSPTLEQVTFTDNYAWRGAGLMNDEGEGNPILRQVNFVDNIATYCGGMDLPFPEIPILEQVTFTNNQASTYGGGMCIDGGNPNLTSVNFSHNSAEFYGGRAISHYREHHPFPKLCLMKIMPQQGVVGCILQVVLF